MAKGASVELEYLIALRHAAEQLTLIKKSGAKSPLAGNVGTRFRGRGLEFEEVRHYQTGDELRTLDWRITARTGVPHTKLFREEREKPTLIAVDQRLSMAFGSRHCFKSVQAAETAALLAWAALKQNDRVGGFVFNDQQQLDLRPANSRKTVLKLLDSITQFNQQLTQKPPLNATVNSINPLQINIILGELHRIAKPGSSVFIISDFIGLNENGINQLTYLKRHCDVYAIFISDPMEHQLPQLGSRIFSNGSQQGVYDTNDIQLNASFSARFEQRINTLHSNLSARAIPVINISTQNLSLDILSKFFGKKYKTKRPKPNLFKQAQA